MKTGNTTSLAATSDVRTRSYQEATGSRGGPLGEEGEWVQIEEGRKRLGSMGTCQDKDKIVGSDCEVIPKERGTKGENLQSFIRQACVIITECCGKAIIFCCFQTELEQEGFFFCYVPSVKRNACPQPRLNIKLSHFPQLFFPDNPIFPKFQ